MGVQLQRLVEAYGKDLNLELRQHIWALLSGKDGHTLRSITVRPVLLRTYPNGSLAGHILGLVLYNQTGYYGVEGYYDDILGGLSEKYNGEAQFSEGSAPDLKSMPQIEPAKESAENMKKLILDQLEENNATKEIRHTLFEMALLGTGVLKGPFTFEKDLHRWTKDPETGASAYTPSKKACPMVEAVSCWDLYPDPEATKIEDCNYIIERHKMNGSQLRALIDRPFFRHEEIIKCLEEGPNYTPKGFEHRLQDRENETEFEICQLTSIRRSFVDETG